MMQAKSSVQTIFYYLLLSVLISVCVGRPSHGFGGDGSQNNNDLDTSIGLAPSNDHRFSGSNNQIDTEQLNNFMRLQLLAQQLGVSSNDIESLLPTMTKRQSQLRFRQCYFNPISCFRK